MSRRKKTTKQPSGRTPKQLGSRWMGSYLGPLGVPKRQRPDAYL
ncbi:MAG: hypothetical protein PHU85_19575 [Phycisphaerae bacterium]|nr:hypothetical protein [Phycisphaerae bacterium]